LQIKPSTALGTTAANTSVKKTIRFKSTKKVASVSFNEELEEPFEENHID